MCVFNYPRIWWQEAINSLALVWAPALLVAIGIQLRRLVRQGVSLYAVVSIILQFACVYAVFSTIKPYIAYSKKVAQDIVYSEPISIVLVDDSDRAEKAIGRGLVPTADIVVSVRTTRDQSAEPSRNEALPFTVASVAEGVRNVEIRSRFPFKENPKQEVGYAALPAVFGTVVLPEGVALQLGAFDLLSPVSQQNFVASRLTSRRIASILRFNSTPRMVFGGFRAPITSQIVDMYPDQVRLKSVLFNQGIGGLWRRLREVFSWNSVLNVFVARNIRLEQVVEHEPQRDGWRGISFVARIPLATS